TVQVREDSGASPAEAKSAATVLAGQWHHFAVTRDAEGTIELFLDGATVGPGKSGASKGSITTDMRCLAIEKRWQKTGFGGKSCFKGSVDEICFFNRVLNPVEISE